MPLFHLGGTTVQRSYPRMKPPMEEYIPSRFRTLSFLTLVIAAGGFPLAECATADRLLTADLTSAVLTEYIEAPLTKNSTMYHAERFMRLSTFGQIVLAMSSHGANSVTASALPTQSPVR